MKTAVLAVAVAGMAGVLVSGLFYASRASSQPRSLDLAVYTPIGVVQSGTGAQSIAWVLDSTNRRVVMCTHRMNDSAARIECRSGELPKD